MRLSKYFIFTILFTVVCAYKENSMFIKVAFDLQNAFAIRSAIFVTNIKNDVDNESLLIPLKLYSSNNIQSIIINFKDLSKAVNLYHEVMKPFLILHVKSFEDFIHLINISKQRKTHDYWSLIIFTMELDNDMMNMCLHPKKNYLNVFYNAKILVLCQRYNEIIINEWYSVHSGKLEVQQLATWCSKKGLIFSNNKNIFQRRKLNGISLRATDLTKQSSDLSSNTSVGGLFQDVLELIAVECNFTISYQKLENAYGVYNVTTKQWNGLLGKVIRNETDIAIGEIAQTVERSKVVDFSFPIVPSYLNYYFKKPNNAQYLQWMMFFKPFSLYAGIGLISMLMIGALIMTYIKLNKSKINDKNTKAIYNFWNIIQECFLNTWAIFCNMHLIATSNSTSLQVVYTALYILSFIIFSIYAALLMSHSAIFKPKLIFNTLQDFIDDGTYKITVVKETSYMKKLYSDRKPLSKKLINFVLNDTDLRSTVGGAIHQVCSGMKVIFLMDDWGVRTNMPANCELIAFHQEHLINMGFAFVKNSPYVELFDYYLQKFRDYGILHAMKTHYHKQLENFDYNYESVTIITSIPLFSIVLLGMGLSLLVLICEIIHFRFRSKYVKRHYEFLKSKTNYWKPLIRPIK